MATIISFPERGEDPRIPTEVEAESLAQADLGNVDGAVVAALALANGAVAKAGDTFTGSVSLSVAAADIALALSANAGQTRAFYFKTGGVLRWASYADNITESGSNAGSDFRIARYSDAGSFIDNPLTISRSTSIVTIPFLSASGYVRPGSYTVGTVPSAAAALAGATIYVSNETGGGTLAFSDGTNWRRVQDRNIVS